MSIQNKPVVAAAAAGVVVGAIVVVTLSTIITGDKADHSQELIPVVSPQNLRSSNEGGHTPISPVHPQDRQPGGDDLARIASLEQRLDAIGASRSQSNFEKQSRFDEPEGIDDEANADEVAIEDARYYELESWEQKKQSFAAEPVDETWGLKARESIESDVLSIAQGHGLTVVDADCRTTQCRVVVEWPSYGDAVNGFTEFLHHDYKVNCAKETLLPEPAKADSGLPYQMTVLFDCADVRDTG